MPDMRTKAVVSCLLAVIMLTAAVLKVSPTKVGAPAGHEHSSALPVEAHLHLAGHSHTPHDEAPGHQHRDDVPGGTCTSICCAAGMACCAALMAAPLDTRLSYERILLRAPFGEVLAGIEPPVPLRPPRATA